MRERQQLKSTLSGFSLTLDKHARNLSLAWEREPRGILLSIFHDFSFDKISRIDSDDEISICGWLTDTPSLDGEISIHKINRFQPETRAARTVLESNSSIGARDCPEANGTSAVLTHLSFVL